MDYIDNGSLEQYLSTRTINEYMGTKLCHSLALGVQFLHLEINEEAKRQNNKEDDSLENLLKGAKSCQYESQADWPESKTGLFKQSGHTFPQSIPEQLTSIPIMA